MGGDQSESNCSCHWWALALLICSDVSVGLGYSLNKGGLLFQVLSKWRDLFA